MVGVDDPGERNPWGDCLQAPSFSYGRPDYFADLPQSEVARILDLHPKQVSRLWLAATGRLAQWLDGFEDRTS